MENPNEQEQFELEAKQLLQLYQAAQGLFELAIKNNPIDQRLINQAIKDFSTCESQLNEMNKKYENVKWGFRIYLKDTFIENFRHALNFTLADIYKYKKPPSKDLIRKYMESAKKSDVGVYAIPVGPLYTNDVDFTLKNAINSVKSNKQNAQFVQDFMIAHIYHHGLGSIKANHMIAISLYEKAITYCTTTINPQTQDTLPVLYFCLGLLYLNNVLNTSDFEKAANKFILAIKATSKNHTASGFFALIQLYTLHCAKIIICNLSDFDLLLFKNELLIFAQTQLANPRVVDMLVEMAKTLLYDPRNEAFQLGKTLMGIFANGTNNSVAILAYANTFLHGIIPSQIKTKPPKKVKIFRGLTQALEWQSKCEATENKYTHFNIGSVLFKCDALYLEKKLTKEQVISIYNSKNSNPLSSDISDLQLRQRLVGSAIYRMKLALPDSTGAVSLVLACAYLQAAYLAYADNNLREHLKFYRLHLQTRSESLEMDVQSVTRNEVVLQQIEDLQDQWSNEDTEDALAKRQQQIRAIQVDINTQILDASRTPNVAPPRMVSDLLETFLSSDVVNATDEINIATITTIIGKIFLKNSFDTALYIQNAQLLDKFFNLISRRSKNFGPREYHNIFCGLSRIAISNNKIYSNCVETVLQGLLAPQEPYQQLPRCLTFTPYLCDLFHSISRLEMPNICVLNNLPFILNCAQMALSSAEPEDVINLLYPLAKLHAGLVRAQQEDAANAVFTVVTSEFSKLASLLTANPEFDRHETVHQGILLIHYIRQIKKIPEIKDEILQKFKGFFDQHFRRFPIATNTTESSLQSKTTTLIIKTVKPYLKGAKFLKEHVINGLPVDLVIKLPKIRNKRPSVLIPIQIHGTGHFFHSNDQSLTLMTKEHLHNVIIGDPVIINYQEFESLEGKSHDEVFAFLQQKFLPHFSMAPTSAVETKTSNNEWTLVQ